jgi:hypothetical protein
MSGFPKGGDIEATRAWLDKKGFVVDRFVGFEADSLCWDWITGMADE